MPLVEFTSEYYLILAFTFNGRLIVINAKCHLFVYSLDQLASKIVPTAEQLEVERVKLISPAYEVNLLRAKVFDYYGVIKAHNWSEVTSEYKS